MILCNVNYYNKSIPDESEQMHDHKEGFKIAIALVEVAIILSLPEARWAHVETIVSLL